MVVFKRLNYCKQKLLCAWVLPDILCCARTEVGLGGLGDRQREQRGLLLYSQRLPQLPWPWAAAYLLFYFMYL